MRLAAACLIGAAALLAACASLPSLDGRIETHALTQTDDTRLGRALSPQATAHAGRTGVFPLDNARDAFAARVVLAASAERSIDAQYYIWHGDQTGTLLFEALWNAAERGVRVRLLLDDMNTRGLDPVLAALDAHGNIEVRLYNPFASRSARSLDFLTDFSRVNRRMHNKSFTVDNQASIMGGRNIGNEYFAAGSDIAFADLDVAVAGAAVQEISRQFDRYWSSPSAYPVTGLVAPEPAARETLAARFAATRADPVSTAYIEAVAATPLVREILDRTLAFEWTDARLFYDDPAKTLDESERKDILLLPQLLRTAGRAETRFDLISPYFVPGDGGTAALVEQARKGVRIRILTNSLASLDEAAVFAGYAHRRIDLLRAGVRIFEIKPDLLDKARKKSPSEHGNDSSGSSALHAKTFAADGQRVFVGSFNMDQRSTWLNTELGLLIESPRLAHQMAERFETTIPLDAYEVVLAGDGKSLAWIERTPSGEVRYDTEPQTSWWRRFKVNCLSILPIEWLL